MLDGKNECKLLQTDAPLSLVAARDESPFTRSNRMKRNSSDEVML
jgi:hypothetical protein